MDILALFCQLVDSLLNEEADSNCPTLKMSCHTHHEQETSSLISSGERILVTDLHSGSTLVLECESRSQETWITPAPVVE